MLSSTPAPSCAQRKCISTFGYRTGQGDVVPLDADDPAAEQAARLRYKLQCLEELHAKGLLNEKSFRVKRDRVNAAAPKPSPSRDAPSSGAGPLSPADAGSSLPRTRGPLSRGRGVLSLSRGRTPAFGSSQVQGRNAALISPRVREHDPTTEEVDFVLSQADANHDNKIEKSECLAALGLWLQILKDDPSGGDGRPGHDRKSGACVLS